jgi:predicted RND superfamily exporter protein
MSQSEDSYLARPFALITRIVIQYPVTTTALAILLAIGALAYTAEALSYKTSRLDLLNPNSDYNRLWIEYIQEFGEDDDAVVVVEGGSRDDVIPVLEEVSQALAREDQLFNAVLHEVNLSSIRSKGLHYLSAEELQGVKGFLTGLGPIVEGGHDANWSPLNLGFMTRGLAAQLQAEPRASADRPTQSEVQLERLSTSLLGVLSQRSRYQSPWPQMPASFATLSELNTEYLLTNEGRLGFVLLRMARNQDSFTGASEATDTLRQLIARSQARHPEVKIGLTGLPIMEDDEMRSSQSSMFWASVLSFIGVGLLFIAGFGGLRHALLANLVLLIGMAWSFGYVTLVVGHLNILSVSFTVTLIGIGIDYGIHYIARYMQLREHMRNAGDALVATSRTISPAILTGAVATAISFFAAGSTSFTGVAELGIIAGGGILLCAVAQLVVLPATVQLIDRTSWGRSMPQPLPVHSWIEPLMRAPRALCLVTSLATVFVSAGMTRLWYDSNLLNMQPEGLESVELERKLLAETNQSVWYALSMADSREELLARKAQFLKMPSVERTEEIVSMLPADHAEKKPIIAEIGEKLSNLPERPPVIMVDRPDELGRIFGGIQDQLVRAGRSAVTARNIEQIRDILRRMPVADCYRAVYQFQQHMAPRVTGNPLQAYEASLEMKQSYQMAALYAGVIIVTLLAFDFRSLKYACLAATPLLVGLFQMFGLLGWLDIPLNPANLIALPLILGIGVDYGVHIVHDYREQRGPYRMSPSTAVAVLVDSLTTIVGYGALMIASHKGLQSLGRVLSIGVTCCLFTSIIMLPALLRWMTRHRSEVEDDAELNNADRHLLKPYRRVDGAHPPGYQPHTPVRTPQSLPEVRVA